MREGFSGRDAPPREAALEDRRMWRLLLGRLHPDADGDPELFLFACALKDRLGKESRTGAGPEQPPHAWAAWRRTMGAWASLNREGLRKPGVPAAARPRGFPRGP